MTKLLIEPHYLGSIEYFCLLSSFQQVEFEVCDSFQKQTYRNRTLILGANKVLPLIIPLSYSNHTPTKDVRIDYSQRWIKDHWGAIYSSYGKAPYFEFFSDEWLKILEGREHFLVDLLIKFMRLPLKLLNITLEINFTKSFTSHPAVGFKDYRNLIQPKIDFPNRNIFRPVAYSQLFGDSFVSNLSIIDLIMCEGPRVDEIVKKSSRL
ncbi:MAG: WbqC family protein [Bacteroidota bacterium]